MCKVKMLRALVNERLTVAVEEIFVVLERTMAEYEEELCRTKEENERQRQLLDAVFKPQMESQLAAVSEEDLPPEEQEWSSKMEQQEEPQPPHVKKEEEDQVWTQEDADISKFPVTRVIVKSEDEAQWLQLDRGPSLEKRRPEAGSLLAPLSDSEDTAPRSPGTDDEDSKADMTSHADNKHFKCAQCDKTFDKKTHLKIHMRTHTGEKPFRCSVCGERFSQKGNLMRHTKRHTGEKTFSCAVCGQLFSSKSNLMVHTRTHTGERPFSCAICKTGFSSHSSLLRHMRTHTGEKPFACSFCQKTFSQREHLIAHTRTHTGEKPFLCSVCNVTFTFQSSLVRHMVTHTDDKPFPCSLCGETFSLKSTLRKHTRKHTGEKSFSCESCEGKFSYKYQLSKHACAVCVNTKFVEPISSVSYKQWSTSGSVHVNQTGCSAQPSPFGDAEKQTCEQSKSQLKQPSFAEVMQLIQEGKAVPGVTKLDIQASNRTETPSQMERILKPWEVVSASK